MDTWKNAFFLQEKPMSIKKKKNPPFRGGGILGFGGGGSADFIFMRTGIFLIKSDSILSSHF